MVVARRKSSRAEDDEQRGEWEKLISREAIEAAAAEATKRHRRQTVNRDKWITIRVTENERDMVKWVAGAGRGQIAAFVREAALDVARFLIEAEGEEPGA